MRSRKPIKFEVNLDSDLAIGLKRIVDNGRARTIKNMTLAFIGAGGILTLTSVVHGISGTFSKLFGNKKEKQKALYEKMWRNFQTMKQERSFEFVEERDGHVIYKITPRGKEKIKRVIFDELSINTAEKWDGKWRLIIFDIPEKFKVARNALSKKLREMNFYQCQKSVWIHPFPCLEEIEFIKDIFEIKPFVKIFIVNEMTDGKTLYHFNGLLKKNAS